jgi:hypothetical protein
MYIGVYVKKVQSKNEKRYKGHCKYLTKLRNIYRIVQRAASPLHLIFNHALVTCTLCNGDA